MIGTWNTSYPENPRGLFNNFMLSCFSREGWERTICILKGWRPNCSRQTHRRTQATTIPGGQNWPWVKAALVPQNWPRVQTALVFLFCQPMRCQHQTGQLMVMVNANDQSDPVSMTWIPDEHFTILWHNHNDITLNMYVTFSRRQCKV